MVAAGAALIGTCYGLARFAYGLFAPELSREFAMDSTISGVIGSGSYVGYCLAIVASLVLTPRWGPRPVAVLAGLVATVGLAIVAAAPSAPVLAAGILIAGCSTGVASPPMADAVQAWVRQDARARAQTVVNAGTGLGVLVSGPVALLLLDQWRWAWAAFACVAAVATGWVYVAVPAGSRPIARTGSDPQIPICAGVARTEGRHPHGMVRLLVASFLMGLSSIAVWTFGRDLIINEGNASTLVSATTWTILGAAGVLGAFGGDLIQRVGLPSSWVGLMLAMGTATGMIAFTPSAVPVVFTAAAVFGASYIGLTGLALLWSTHLYPDRASFGVGLAFFTIAAGQAFGAPLVGRLADTVDTAAVFYGWVVIAILGAAVRPPTHDTATTPTGP